MSSLPFRSGFGSRAVRQELPISTAGPRSRWLVELVAVFSLLIVALAATVGTHHIATLSPHPFWIAVLLLSWQHGTLAGVAAALVAIVLHWYFGHSSATAGVEDFYDYLYRMWREPALWLVAAVVLGGLRAQQVQKAERLHDRLLEAKTQLSEIAALVKRSRSHCADLERRIATSMDRSVEAGFATVEAVRTSTRDGLASTLPDAVRLLVGPASYSIATFQAGRLVLEEELSCIQAEPTRQPSAAALPMGLESELVRGRRVLSLRREEDLEILAGAALIAAPIASDSHGQVIGALIVHSMEPMRLTQECELSIAILCRALAHALSRERVVVSFVRERHANRGAGTNVAD